MTRNEECCRKVNWLTEHCDLDIEVARELNKRNKFIDDHPEITGISTNALRPLIRETNEQIKQKAILSLSKALESKKHPITGKFCNKLVGKDVLATISKIKIETGLEPISERKEIESIDTGIRCTCPICKKTYGLIHIEPLGLHRFLDMEQMKNKDKVITKLITDDIDDTFDYLAEKFGEDRSTLLREVFVNMDKENKILLYASEKLGMTVDEIVEDIEKEK